MTNPYPRGSEWRKWDLQVHTPYSVLNNGFGDDWDNYVTRLFKKAIQEEMAVIGITDYFTIEGYKKVLGYLSDLAKMSSLFSTEEIEKINEILILPNIEFRLYPLNGNRINFHVVFSNDVPTSEIEENFLHNLHFVREGAPFETDEKRKLKIINLEELGKKLKEEHEPFRGRTDLYIGMMNAVTQDEEIVQELINGRSIFKGKYVLVLPADEDLSTLSWDGQDHNTRKKITQKANFIFSANQNTIAWGLGKKHSSQDAFKSEFKSLKPCLWSSDAHDFEKMFCPDQERYTWVKVDPIYAGLKQVLNEPETRVFIGSTPPNFKHDHKIISSISIPSSNGWFGENFNLTLNRDLTTIIGGRGSGKSALAEAIAYGAGSKDGSKNAFLQKASKHKNPITGSKIVLTWLDGTPTEFTVGQIADGEDAELVQYLPQGAVEELCSHDNSEKLRKQIENVIFQALDETQKMGASNFEELSQQVLANFQFEKEQIINSIRSLNANISHLQNILKSQPEKEKTLKEKLAELERLKKSLPRLPAAEQRGQQELSRLLETKKLFEAKIIDWQSTLTKVSEIEVKVKVFKSKIGEFNQEINVLLASLKIAASDRFNATLDEAIFKEALESKKTEIQSSVATLREGAKQDVAKLLSVSEEQLPFDNLQSLNKGIENKQKETRAFETTKIKYQQQVKAISDLQNAIKALQAEIEKIKNIDPELSKNRTQRTDAYINYFSLLKSEKIRMEELYRPLQDSLSSGTETDKKLVFEAQINYRLAHHIKTGLENIDRSRKGNFRDSNTLKKALSDMSEAFLRGDYEKSIIEENLRKLALLFTTFNEESITVQSQLRENKSMEDFYNWFFDPSYFEIISSLQFNGTDLYLLSPGQKGIILLMLYLEIDKADYRPLIIDQPEENLDNLSVYKDLIGYFRERKQYRQIIMVTHNPNLVVNTDSEQVIVADYDGKRLPRLNYCTGSLEDQARMLPDIQLADLKDGIIEQVCSILEGGETAFEKRKQKYKLSIKSQIQ